MKTPELNAEQALERLSEGATVFLDVRDAASFRRGHIPGARHIGDHNIAEFVERAEKTETIIMYCFHGNSSLGGAAHLLSQGFEEVYSMSGGFAAWGDKPTESEPEPERPKPPPRPAHTSEPVAERAQPISRRRRVLSRLRGLIGR
jgi:thiosulfate sulfurtransferase